jgi:hypothetical protein
VRMLVAFLCCLAVAVAAGSCTRASSSAAPMIPSPVATSPGSSTSIAPTPSPTRPATPATRPPTSGVSTATCKGGWTTPPKGSTLWNFPLGVIRRAAGVPGPFAVVDMRTFVGPESPPSDKNYLMDIRRWYVKLYEPRDLSFQGRFLVEDRRFGKGLAAVAPYDTQGFTSPDWVGFQYDAGNRQAYTYAGLPGSWRGMAYDFVNGGQGLTFPGLPADLAGCLQGT